MIAIALVVVMGVVITVVVVMADMVVMAAVDMVTMDVMADMAEIEIDGECCGIFFNLNEVRKLQEGRGRKIA